MTDRASHWNEVYRTKDPLSVSWYAPRLETSLRLIEAAGLGPSSRVIDVGGGAATLVDHLLELGLAQVAVLDVAVAAFDHARARLGGRADDVEWIEGDVTQVTLPVAAYDIWHDRAVFHFLTAPAHRRAYVATMSRALAPGGQAVLACFATDGPERCSGLDVVRYSPEALAEELGAGFSLVEQVVEAHRTPGGAEQRFTYCRFLCA